jgi:hypothetical protein
MTHVLIVIVGVGISNTKRNTNRIYYMLALPIKLERRLLWWGMIVLIDFSSFYSSKWQWYIRLSSRFARQRVSPMNVISTNPCEEKSIRWCQLWFIRYANWWMSEPLSKSSVEDERKSYLYNTFLWISYWIWLVTSGLSLKDYSNWG